MNCHKSTALGVGVIIFPVTHKHIIRQQNPPNHTTSHKNVPGTDAATQTHIIMPYNEERCKEGTWCILLTGGVTLGS